MSLTRAADASAGFPRSARLLKPADFKRVLGSGRRRRSASFTAVEAEAEPATGPRLGMTVSRKNVPDAVARNRFKRIVRESFRHQRQLPRLDIVIMASAGARSIDRRELAAELNQYWDRLRTRWPAS